VRTRSLTSPYARPRPLVPHAPRAKRTAMSRHPLPQNKPTPTTSSRSSSTRKTRPRHNLVEIATRLAGQHEVWEPLVRYDPISRYYARLANEPDFEAWLLTWVPGQGTDWHDHGGSGGAFVVLQGALVEGTAVHGLVRGTRYSGIGKHHLVWKTDTARPQFRRERPMNRSAGATQIRSFGRSAHSL